jgi:tRNA(Arg) A34 adenosine deaminase TadA
MSVLIDTFQLGMPEWFGGYAAGLPEFVKPIEERMKIIIEMSRLNVEHDTGGPFAAGVFESDSGRIISLGVNRVMHYNCSCAHAEIMALSLAQQKLGTFDLGGSGCAVHDLFVNWLPCTMCFGAVLWSGVKRLVIAGHGRELEEITGFDEGPRPANWESELTGRRIAVITDIMRNEAIQVFSEFRARNRFVYNARQDGSICPESGR